MTSPTVTTCTALVAQLQKRNLPITLYPHVLWLLRCALEIEHEPTIEIPPERLAEALMIVSRYGEIEA